MNLFATTSSSRTPFHSPSLPRSAARRQRRQIWLAVAPIAPVIAVMAGVAYLFHSTESEPGIETALCGEHPPLAHVAVLLDLTDPLSGAQHAEALRVIGGTRDTLPVGARLSLYVLRAPRVQTPAEIVPVFSRCRPRDGSGVIGPTDNPRILKQGYERNFARPVGAAIARMTEPAPAASTSPIVEALHQLAASREFAPEGAARELVIISDMLQKSDALDQFSKGAPKSFEKFADSRSHYLSAVKRLAGTQVRVLQLSSRYPGLQTPAHAAFWEAYFKSAGVSDYQVTRF